MHAWHVPADSGGAVYASSATESQTVTLTVILLQSRHELYAYSSH
jgi:hypothetical protein